jgi:predicted amino acid racemase
MFLDVTLRRNPELIRAAVTLHQAGEIPANTYILDLDRIASNAQVMHREADRNGIRLYLMTKQFGRNPLAAAATMTGGLQRAVAVDTQCTKVFKAFDIPLGHAGHLVQIPQHDLIDVVGMRPSVLTVFSVENARRVSAAARAVGVEQALLLRVRGPADVIYPNEEGGFKLSEIYDDARTISRLQNVRIAGVTSFPCVLYRPATRQGEPTVNFVSVLDAAAELRRLHIEVEQINVPGATSTAMIPVIARHGGTHGEPGHGLLGTTPWHADEDLPESPAIVYVSEVSHIFDNRAYVIGGGFYAGFVSGVVGTFSPFEATGSQRPPQALVGHTEEAVLGHRLSVDPASFLGKGNATDYYGGTLELGDGVQPEVGDSVIYAFRAQPFVTRAYTAAVSGISTDAPRVEGVFDRAAHPVTANGHPIVNGYEACRGQMRAMASLLAGRSP